MATSTVETAAMTGVRLKSISSNICGPDRFATNVDMKNATVASSNEARKATQAAACDTWDDGSQNDEENASQPVARSSTPPGSSVGSTRCSDAVRGDDHIGDSKHGVAR